MKIPFLIIILIFNISTCFSINESAPEDSLVEFGIWEKILYQYSTTAGAFRSCWNMIVAKRDALYEIKPFIGKKTCEGTLTSCAWAGNVTACVSTVGDFNIRWIKGKLEEKEYVYGQFDTCPEKAALTVHRTNQFRSVCVCNCFQTNWGVHLGLMQSRESDNYVIITIRFIVRNNVLYLQPAEGKLNENHKISGFSWIPLPNGPTEIYRIDFGSHNFFLDDSKLNENYALTGIKFEYMEATKPNLVKGFGISASGRLVLSNSQLDLNPAKKLTIKPNPSAKRYFPAQRPDSKKPDKSLENGEYVEIKQAPYELNYGQVALPYFHNREQQNNYELLFGFGIILDYSSSKGPFISLRLHSYKSFFKFVFLK